MRVELDLLSLVVKVSRVVLLDLLHWIFASLAAEGGRGVQVEEREEDNGGWPRARVH